VQRYQNLTIIPYVSDYAEFAGRTREEILRRKGSDFIVAVDLPQGLEDEILKAVRSLPETSLIIDAMRRGILITPTSAPVEAIRSYLEYGYELHCIDASLPVTGNISEYEYFIQMCKLHGPERVINQPEQFGISQQDLVHAWADTVTNNVSGTPSFVGLRQRCTPQDCPPFDPVLLSQYQITRLQSMAMHLKKLIESGLDVVFVCSRMNVSGVLTFLSSELPSFDDSYHLPVKICRIPETMLFTLSREMPFIMYTYELYRDAPFDREKWIRYLYTENCGSHSLQQITGTIEYAFRLALTDNQVFPDLYNVTAAAKYFMDDLCALKIYEKAISYPPSRNLKSNCTFKSIVDYNLTPFSETRILNLKSVVVNKPVRSINPRSRKRKSSSSDYYRFTRTNRCLKAELDLMKYVTSLFRSSNISEHETMPVAFTCGFQKGIDYRQTIRHHHFGRVFVKQPVHENNSCYIFDFRTPEDKSQTTDNGGKRFRFVMTKTQSEGVPTHVFFDKNYPWVGVTLHAGNHYSSKLMMAFMSLPFSPTKIYDKISYSNPLVSSIDLGMKYAKLVFVFSNNAGELKRNHYPHDRLKVYPLKVLPKTIQEKMRSFDIVGYRYNDRPGD
jgi:hypothetical protein